MAEPVALLVAVTVSAVASFAATILYLTRVRGRLVSWELLEPLEVDNGE